MNSYDLGGHSGCRILLIQDEKGRSFVRKTARDKEYNARLKQQCRKQSEFTSNRIRTPRVMEEGTTEDGLFYFDMEYIQGVTLAEYMKSIEIGKIRGLAVSLTENLIPAQQRKTAREEKETVNRIFQAKTATLEGKLAAHKNPVIAQALLLMKKHDWSNLPQSPCHGDLTLENIIMKNDSIYLIDFLDSFYDSWMFDVGALLQDVWMLWSYRFEAAVSMNTVLRLKVFRDVLLEQIEKVDPRYVVEIYYALLQKLIRIYPYVKDQNTYRFLNEKTALLLKKIELEENPYGNHDYPCGGREAD